MIKFSSTVDYLKEEDPDLRNRSEKRANTLIISDKGGKMGSRR